MKAEWIRDLIGPGAGADHDAIGRIDALARLHAYNRVGGNDTRHCLAVLQHAAVAQELRLRAIVRRQVAY